MAFNVYITLRTAILGEKTDLCSISVFASGVPLEMHWRKCTSGYGGNRLLGYPSMCIGVP